MLTGDPPCGSHPLYIPERKVDIFDVYTFGKRETLTYGTFEDYHTLNQT